MNALWVAVQLIIGFNLVFPLLLAILFFIIKSATRKHTNVEGAGTDPDYAIIVTAYEQVDLIPTVVNSILQINYKNYLVYVVADKCDISGLSFSDERVVVLRPEQTIASNTGSHFYAISHFHRPHERLTIIDSDNLVHPEYLNELNRYFAQGFEAVQGVREAKNFDTVYACLDAARDKYYHYYDGKMLFGAGSSATLAGSGMAFTTELYKKALGEQAIQGAGFDKVLQYEIVKSGKRIAFAADAIVYDEKTAHQDQLVKQRARWINTWFRYFKFGFALVGKGMLNGNWNQLLFGTVLLRPPLFIFLALSGLFMLANIFIDPLAAAMWAASLALFITGFFVALLSSDTNKEIYRSLAGIPKFMFLQIVSLTKARKANKISVATRHTGGNAS